MKSNIIFRLWFFILILVLGLFPCPDPVTKKLPACEIRISSCFFPCVYVRDICDLGEGESLKP